MSDFSDKIQKAKCQFLRVAFGRPSSILSEYVSPPYPAHSGVLCCLGHLVRTWDKLRSRDCDSKMKLGRKLARNMLSVVAITPPRLNTTSHSGITFPAYGCLFETRTVDVNPRKEPHGSSQFRCLGTRSVRMFDTCALFRFNATQKLPSNA